MISRISITSREMWLAARKTEVTASSVAALFNEHDFKTYYRLWMEKAGRIEEESDEPIITENSITLSPMGRGTELESVAGNMLRRMKPNWVIKKGTDYYRDADGRVGATPDYECNDPIRGFGNVQIKNPDAFLFRQDWLDENKEVVVPLGYIMQTVLESHLMGAKWAAVGILTVGQKTRLELIEVPIHKGIIARIYEEVADFWDSIEAGDEPTPDYKRDGETIRKIYKQGGDPAIDLSTDNRIGFLCEEKLAWNRRRLNADHALEEVDAEIETLLKDAEKATHPDFKITYKTQKTGGFTIPAGTTRVLRITRNKEKEA